MPTCIITIFQKFVLFLFLQLSLLFPWRVYFSSINIHISLWLWLVQWIRLTWVFFNFFVFLWFSLWVLSFVYLIFPLNILNPSFFCCCLSSSLCYYCVSVLLKKNCVLIVVGIILVVILRIIISVVLAFVCFWNSSLILLPMPWFHMLFNLEKERSEVALAYLYLPKYINP